MKKIYSFFILISSFLYSNSILIESINNDVAQVRIAGKSESCSVTIKSTGVVGQTNCVKITNSKKVKILCTKRKKVCKTEDEIREFVGMNPSASNYKTCLNNAISDYDMRVCNGKELERQDKRLNKYYKQAMKSKINNKVRLKKAQRAWMKYRDSKCEAEAAPMEGGTGEMLLMSGCLVDTTRLRADELKTMI